MIRGGAGRGDTGIGTTGAQIDGDLASRHIGECHGKKEGRDTTRPTLEQDGMIPLCGGESADATANDHPGTMRISLGDLKASILQGHDTRGNGIVDTGVHLLTLFFLDILPWLKLLHLCGDARRKVRSI